MRQILALAALMVAFSASAFAQAGGVEQQIRDLEKQSREAAIRGDAAFAERTLASDYISIAPSGAVSTREQTLATARAGTMKLQSINVEDEKVRVYGGNVAVVTGHASVTGTDKGQAFTGHSRYTRVWVKQNGGWKLAAFQLTPIAGASTAQPGTPPTTNP